MVPSGLIRAVGIVICLPVFCQAQEVGAVAEGGAASIKVNQIGFLPAGRKIAIVPLSDTRDFQLRSAATGEVVFSSELRAAKHWPYSGERVHVADFSFFSEPGRYYVSVQATGRSPEFSIGANVYDELAAMTQRAFYFNRAGIELHPQYAGTWSRPAGHPDDEVVVHASASSDARPTGSVIAAPGGWYDAGDYNKYAINASFSTYTLLAAYVRCPFCFDAALDIPERQNDLADLLDEVLWNLNWLERMQDPDDGGVYHKLTTREFAGMVMPHEAGQTRYVVGKTTGAALGFSAVFAMASRVYGEQRPDLATRYLRAAEAAWRWAGLHPDVGYVQPEDIRTGTYFYEHEDFADEFFWAASELYLATGDGSYIEGYDLEAMASGGVPTWDYVQALAWMSLATSDVGTKSVRDTAREKTLSTARFLRQHAESSAYAVTMGAYSTRFMSGFNERDFAWGSNGNAAYHGVLLLVAYELSGQTIYRNLARANLDYLLGRNPLGLSFVTGAGSRYPRNIHHRPSAADRVDEPVPGFLVGGPHDGQQDAADCAGLYRSKLPALSYVDALCSYATNEVAINWNAPMVYLSALVAAESARSF